MSASRKRPAADPAIVGAIPASADGRPTLACTPLERTTSDAAWHHLQAANAAADRPELYVHGDWPVRLRTTQAGNLVTQPLTLATMREAVDARTRCHVLRKREWAPCYPPKDLAEMMLADPTPPLPPLRAIVRVPVFDAAGRLRTTPGYSPDDGLLLLPDFTPQAVPTRPTATDVLEARARIQELLRDFPFVSDADRTHAVGLLVLSIARELIAGPTPLHGFDASAAGSGKNLLKEALLLPALGDGAMALWPLPEEEDEMRKTLLSLLAEGCPLIHFDNVKRRLSSGVLSAALTATEYSGRLLGTNRNGSFRVGCLWTLTGNNLSGDDEMIRRLVPIRLEPSCEIPEERTDFAHHPLLEWERDPPIRAGLVWAAHVLVQHWLAAGRPAPPPATTPMLGSYDDWRRVIGGILGHAAYPGFLAGRRDLRATADPDTEAWRAFVAAWHARHQTTEVTVADLLPLAEQAGVRIRGDTDKKQATALGSLLGRRRGRVFANQKITRGISSGPGKSWALEPLDAAAQP